MKGDMCGKIYRERYETFVKWVTDFHNDVIKYRTFFLINSNVYVKS